MSSLHDDISLFLFRLQESGTENMWGCPAVAVQAFPDEDSKTVKEMALYWMKNYAGEKKRLKL